MSSGTVIDLNADLGEGCGNDAALYSLITTANVAGGGHAGGGAILQEAVAAAARNRVAIGAHPGYPDRDQFGRVSLLDHSPAGSFFASITDQILAVGAAAQQHGQMLTHVKAHGALYNDACVRFDAANLVVESVLRASADLTLPGAPLPIMGMPGSLLERVAAERGIPFIAEGFADRAYAADGTLVPRHEPGAVLDTIDAVTAQARQIALTGTVTAIDGTILPMPVRTICVHGDTPDAIAITQAIRRDLTAHQVAITRESGTR
jgi:UPF0271 protein